MLRFNDPRAIKEISQSTNVGFKPGHDQCVARFKDNVLLGGALFTDYNIASIQIHVAGFQTNWMDRELLWISVDWPFNTLDVKKIFALVRENNITSLEFCANFGFKVETRVTDVFPCPGGDMLVHSIYKDDCRFLKMRRPKITVEGNDGQVYSVP